MIEKVEFKLVTSLLQLNSVFGSHRVLDHVIPCDHYLLRAHEENPEFSISAFSEEYMTAIDCDSCVLFPGWFRMLFLNPCLLEYSSMGVPC